MADETEEFEFRLRAEKERAQPRAAPVPQDVSAAKPSAPVDPIGSVLQTVTEPITSIATGLAGTALGGLAGMGAALIPGLPQGIGRDVSERVQQALTYQPRSAGAQAVTQAISYPFEKLAEGADYAGGAAAESSGSPALGAGVNTAIQALAPVGVFKGAQLGGRGAAAARGAMTREQPMAGMGSAMTDEARLRMERAAALDTPISLTKGQATRTFEQQQFERETAKNPDAGLPLRERFADQNAKILQNFDTWLDQTGAEAGSLRTTGQIVNDALVNKARMAKAHVDSAYNQARKSGETAAPINVKPLMDYVESHQPEAINAPIISSVQAKLKAISKENEFGQPQALLNDIEEVRKMVGALSGKDATNGHFGRELKGVIDQMTEGVGGKDYQRARALRLRYGKEFEDVGIIDKLLRTKPGTSDRAVAFEDVFNHSILSGSLDDVRTMRKTLQTAGADGQKAWRELQGQTVQHIKDSITKGASPDIRGNPIVSADKLNRTISELDKDGKLDFIFGKQGAQKMRDINDIAKDVYTSPPGSVNTSNTASVVLAALDTILSGTTGLPLPVGTAANYGIKKYRGRILDKRVADALAPPE